MSTSTALVCINLKPGGGVVTKRGGGGGVEMEPEKELVWSSSSSRGGAVEQQQQQHSASTTQALVQALVDNGIIQLSHKSTGAATIRVIDTSSVRAPSASTAPQEFSDLKTLSLGTFNIKPSSSSGNRTSLLVERETEVEEGSGGSSKLVSLIQSRPLLIQQRNSSHHHHLVYSSGSSHQQLQSEGGGKSAVLHLVRQTTRSHGGGPTVVATTAEAVEIEPPKPAVPPPLRASISHLQPSQDGEPIKLPDNLECLPKAEHFPTVRHRWNTNEEIAAILISFGRHLDWQSKEVKIRPESGSMLLYSRKKVRYRRDGYCWKKRKDGKTTREDHMKLKVQGTECIYGCYVHSAILPTFHRRCYWLLQNPDIVLVHYLNVPYPDDNKMVCPSLALCADKKQWTKEELLSQLKPMFYSEEEPDLKNELDISTAETVESIVCQLLERQRSARASAICKQLECGCPDSTCPDAKSCLQPIRRISAAEPDSNQVSSTTGSALLGTLRSGQQQAVGHEPRLYHSSHEPCSNPLLLSLQSHTQQPAHTASLLILNSQSTGQISASILSGRHQQIKDKSEYDKARSDLFGGSEAPDGRSKRKEETEMKSSEGKKETVGSDGRIATSGDSGRTTVGGDSSISDRTVEGDSGRLVEGDRGRIVGEGDSGRMVGGDSTTTSSRSVGGDSGRTIEGDSGRTTGGDSGGHTQFYETLDLSQEDIQRTLSANMPLTCSTAQRSSREGSQGKHSSALGEIEFIDVNAQQPVDDVFLNLDAFDMLAELSDLDGLDQQQQHQHTESSVNGERRSAAKGASLDSPPSHRLVMDYREGTANITDYSPEWAFTEGGVKVLVTGPWYSTTSPYRVLFDSTPVPTTLVQSGVLRCFCPAHEEGVVTLQVACEGFVISNCVRFEYKGRTQPADCLMRCALSQRLGDLAARLDMKEEPLDLYDSSMRRERVNLEERLVSEVEKLSQGEWVEGQRASEPEEWSETSYCGMTLLHLAASLGYSRLVCSLIQWRMRTPLTLLELEVDGMNQDLDGFTPIMRACERGHSETAQLLYEWLPSSGSVTNKLGQGPIEIAYRFGHARLAGELTARQEATFLPIRRGCSEDSPPKEESPFLQPSPLPRSSETKKVDMELHVNIPEWREESSAPLRASLLNASHKLIRLDRSMSLPLEEDLYPEQPSGQQRMDLSLCDVRRGGDELASSATPSSPLPTIHSSSSQLYKGKEDAKVLTLAEQIIAAMPDRIKKESSNGEQTSSDLHLMSFESSSLIDEPKSSSSSSCCFEKPDFSFENNYRYYEVGTPCSSLSPVSCQLPSSPTFNRSPSPPVTTAHLTEFLHFPNSLYFEKDFSNLTLSDREQRELYEAAKVIQKAYRSYKGRKKLEEADKERQAAVLIQNYYRRYKQYAYFKEMSDAAMVIQNGFRSYCESKRFKKSQESNGGAFQNYLGDEPAEPSVNGLKRTYSQRRQHQAARKIQEFMRQSKNKLQKERAEKEKLDPSTGCPRPS